MAKEWLKAKCPICGKEFQYLSNYKPKTCGKFDCLQAAEKQGLFRKQEGDIRGN